MEENNKIFCMLEKKRDFKSCFFFNFLLGLFYARVLNMNSIFLSLSITLSFFSFYFFYFENFTICNLQESQSGAALDIGAEKGSNISTGWAQIEEREIQQVLRTERHAKCQNMDMSCFPLLPMPTTTSSVAIASATRNTQVYQKRGFFNYYYNNNEQENAHQHNPRTLELFPLNKDGQDDICQAAAANVASMDTSEQFFEFLPLRN